MWISRIRVTGGFLSNLDMRLAPGLNVIIGPRGAGKTTLLELLRHALGVRHADDSRDARQDKLVGTLLGAGEVILDLRTSDRELRVVVDASGAGRSEGTSRAALVLGQNELEHIASSAESRLALIDLRASTVPPASSSLDRAAQITRQLAEIRAERETLVDQLKQRVSLVADRQELMAQEAALLARGSASLTTERAKLTAREDELRELEQWSVQSHRYAEQLVVVYDEIAALQERIDGLVTDGMPPEFIKQGSSDLDRLRDALKASGQFSESLSLTLVRIAEANQQREMQLRLEAAPIRSRLDEAEKGLGEVTARLRNIEGQLGRLELIQGEVELIERQYRQLSHIREDAVAGSELEQEARYRARLGVADAVSSLLEGRVQVTIEHLANADHFRQLLNDLLHGSGLQYRAISENISRTILPRTLVEMIEASDVEGLSRSAEIPESRAARVISQLDDEKHLFELMRVQLEDRADFFLQDGSTRKGVEMLSTGQKCAVTLPIALTEHSRALLLDQPEDHLDNAYLVSTIVGALRDRTSSGAQTIVATHNANIPVLGEAEVVASMNSDGKRGYVTKVGRFSAPMIVDDITDLMEGGVEAFRRRARFYEANSSDFR